MDQVLDESKNLISDLWVDQPDARQRIDERHASGELSDAEADRLVCFVEQGYMAIPVDVDDDFVSRFDEDVERLWRERPADLAAAPRAGDRMSFRDFDEANKAIGYRIVDMHSHSAAALDLYINPQIFRYVELIFGQPAVSFQSLYFRYGSEQSLHRDPMFVPTVPPSHLLASWTALEDISEGCGPLLYAPGSHRMTWFEFAEDSVLVGTKGEIDKRAAWAAERAEQLERLGLEVKTFTCERGDTFIWHAGLLHGGQRVTDPDSTRKSFVTHYSTAATYTRRSASMRAIRSAGDKRGEWYGVSQNTDRMIHHKGHVGLENPLLGIVP